MGCGANQPIDPSWKNDTSIKVLRLRWVKKLYPALPNYLIPEMGEELDRFNPLETGAAGYDTDKRRAFVGTSTGALYCIDLWSSKTLWRFEVDDPVGSIPIYDAEKRAVYFGADDGSFYALQARSGRLLWKTNLGAHIRRKAILHDNTLYLTTADNTILAMAPENGEVIWQYRRLPVEGFSSVGHAGIAMHGSQLLTGFNDGYVAAIDAVSGTVNWSHDLASEVATSSVDGVVVLVDVDATPIISGNVVVAASVAGGMRGLDLKTGNTLWSRPDITNVTGLATNDGVVFAARSAFGLTALNPSSGKIVWSRRFNSGVLQDPVVHDDVVILSDSEFGLLVHSSLSGDLIQKVDPREGFFAQPSIKNGYMLVMANNGTLLAMSVL